jgi:tRNA threonylcarbamoyl adenosine modification protein YeaZ
MLILAIDTALSACSVAVFDTENDRVLAGDSQPMVRGHAEALIPLVKRMMAAAGVAFAQLDRIAVTVGPGSFTGLRVGISAARGMALASGKPAIGLSTLAAFAAPHVAGANDAVIAAAIDAAHGNVYVQVFGRAGRTLLGPRAAPIGDAVHAALSTRKRARGDLPVSLVGPAAELLAAAWPIDVPAPVLVSATPAPEIEWVARLGAAAQDIDSKPKPLYLRAPDARPQEQSRLLRP